MSRIRTVKPEFWSSTQIVRCSRDARLLFIGLWNFCDDHGIHTKDYQRIKMEVFPADSFKEKDIVKLIDELIKNKLVEEYDVDGQFYFKVCSWEKHQKIDKPTYKYPYPFSPKNEQNSTSPRRAFDESSTSIRRVLDESSATEGNGRESKGKEVVNTKTNISEKNTVEFNINQNISEKNKCFNKKIKKSDENFLVLEGEIIDNSGNILETGSKAISKNAQEGLKSSILEVFNEWVLLLHQDSKINAQREKIIKRALKDNSVEKLKKAIKGCTLTPFYMDQNFTQLKHILKDQDTIDMFVRNADKPPQVPINPNNKYAIRSRAFDVAVDHHKDLQRRLAERAAQLKEKEIEEARKQKEELDASVRGQVTRIE